MSENVVQLTVSQILDDLKSGLTRDRIGEKYHLNKAQVKRLFQHPKLKFKKTIITKDPFIIVDDTISAETNQLTLDQGIAEAQAEEEAQQEQASQEDQQQIIEETEAKADAHTQLGVELSDDTPNPPPTATGTAW